jgi:hypothetical protein
MDSHVVAQRLDLQRGKGVIDRLDFLQADNIRLLVLQPAQKMLDPLADGIDVPGGDCKLGHAASGSACRATVQH